jgi:dipeptidyl aminopeptidase/acylaminoacyl peptidase
MAGDIDTMTKRYRRLSPVQHAAHATTPTLILHGDADQRCPIGQSEELFARLLAAKPDLPVEFVRYPGGSHHFPESGTPSHRVAYQARIVGWLTRWLCLPPSYIGSRRRNSRKLRTTGSM